MHRYKDNPDYDYLASKLKGMSDRELNKLKAEYKSRLVSSMVKDDNILRLKYSDKEEERAYYALYQIGKEQCLVEKTLDMLLEKVSTVLSAETQARSEKDELLDKIIQSLAFVEHLLAPEELAE